MNGPSTLPTEFADNPNVDAFLREEGLTDDEWKRVYDLRYCTILVPFAEDSDDGKRGGKDGTVDRNSPSGEDNLFQDQTIIQLSTPKSDGKLTPQVSPRHSRASPSAAPTGLLTPLERKTRSLDHSAIITDDDRDDDTATSLTSNDPLSKYLIPARTHHTLPMGLSHKRGSSPRGESSEENDVSDGETFHDALDQTDGADYGLGSTDRAMSEEPGMLGASKKRRRWEVTPYTPLLHHRPHTETKRVALMSSLPYRAKPLESVGLLRPRASTPAPQQSFIPSSRSSTPCLDNRRYSISSDISTASNLSVTPGNLWSRQDWKELEQLYNGMKGSALSENELDQIADRFLRTHNQHGYPRSSVWSKEMVLTRCIALHRVRGNNQWAVHSRAHSTESGAIRSSNHHGHDHHRASPYPGLGKGSKGDRTDGSISSFVHKRRSERNERHRTAEQGYQIKSVFKHRLATGLSTVRQLLPFWKDVEQGNANVKEQVAIPLVNTCTVQTVVEAFESHSPEEPMSRSGSVLPSSPCSSRKGSVGSDHDHDHDEKGSDSVAKMLANGHATRSAKATAIAASSQPKVL